MQWPPTSACPKYGFDEFQLRGSPLWTSVNSKRSREVFRDTNLTRRPSNCQVGPLSTWVDVVEFGRGHEFAQISSADANPEGAPAEGATTSQVESVRFALSCHIG